VTLRSRLRALLAAHRPALAVVALAFAGAASGLVPSPARADERILSFDSAIAIQRDGSLDVTETIRVHAEGGNIRRGIYRDFPTRYKDRQGNRVVVAFEPLGVLRDGRAEPWFTERRANGVRLNTGDDHFLAVPADVTYTIHYRTTRQLGFFGDHDELYWNVTGLGWSFPIDAVQARVTLPVPVPAAQLRLDAYTGGYGSTGHDASAVADAPGTAVFRTTVPLGPREGLTIAVGFPKGIVAEPSRAQRLRWFLRDNLGFLVALGGLFALSLFYLAQWTRVGRDPQAGPTFPRYAPPDGFGPGELRALQRMGNDRLCFTADVVDMAVRGFLVIHGGVGKTGWRLVRVPGANPDALTASQRALAARLFRDDGEVLLENSEASRVSGTLAAHARALSSKLQPRYYQSHARVLVIGVLGSALVGLAAFLVARGSGILGLLVLGAVALALHIAFAVLMKAPTPEGRKLMDAIDGLKLYLGVAERDELHALRSPQDRADAPPALDAKRYEALLPYAMALGVEQAWTDKFTRAVGAAMAQQAQPAWYQGPAGGPMGLANLGQSLGSTLAAQISASATPPGSSSGGGGGGFSGGGGGGGGGGGR
jgi:uncharacterized membrane protein YgcG